MTSSEYIYQHIVAVASVNNVHISPTVRMLFAVGGSNGFPVLSLVFDKHPQIELDHVDYYIHSWDPWLSGLRWRQSMWATYIIVKTPHWVAVTFVVLKSRKSVTWTNLTVFTLLALHIVITYIHILWHLNRLGWQCLCPTDVNQSTLRPFAGCVHGSLIMVTRIYKNILFRALLTADFAIDQCPLYFQCMSHQNWAIRNCKWAWKRMDSSWM